MTYFRCFTGWCRPGRRCQLCGHLAVALLLLLTTGCAGTTGGKQIDDWCVAGKLREAGAEYFNEHPELWKQHKDFTAPLTDGFRIVAVDCSEALRALGAGDMEEFERRLKALQKNDD